jgi:hypothetical protein
MSIENPFISKNTMMYFDENTSQNIELDQSNVMKYYNTVYLLIKKNNTPIPSNFYNWHIPQETFDKVSELLIIYKTNIKILKNKRHFDSMIMMSGDMLKPYNIFKYELSEKNLVIPIFNIEYLNIVKYLEQYETNNLRDLYNLYVLNNYFEVDTMHSIQLLSNMNESMWWTNQHMLNFTKKFTERRFNDTTAYIGNRKIANILNKIFSNKESKKITKKASKNEDYISQVNMMIDKINKTVTFSEANKIPKKSELTREDINMLFHCMNDKQRFLLYCNLMISPSECHHVVNNMYVIKMMKDVEIKMAPLFRYLKSYAFIELYRKECNEKTNLKTVNESVFDIETASLLPVYPFNHKKPKENPYMPILVSDTELDPANNVCGIPTYNGEYGEGICNLEEFRKLLNIFTTNNPALDLFDGFDFTKYKAAVTGGVMSACLQKKHPLLSRFIGSTETENIINYFNEFYCSSDIDIMFKTKDNYEFIDNVNELYNIIVLNLCKNGDYVEPAHIHLELNKVGCLFVSDQFIIDNIMPKTELSLDSIKMDINGDEMKKLFDPYYQEQTEVYLKNLVLDKTEDEIHIMKKQYPDMFKIDSIDYKVYIGETSTISLVYTYKYIIRSAHMKHLLELFSIKYDDFMGTVSRFHLPCVRAYYDGTMVYMTTSCLSAHLTYMNLDYKYFTGNKDQFDIICKYMMRGGWGIWLNSTEKQQLVEYCANVPFWSNLFSIQPTTDINASAQVVCVVKSLNYKLFRPRLYNMDDYIIYSYVETENRYKNTDLSVVLHNSPTTYMINQKFNIPNNITKLVTINYDMLQSIDKDGNVVPIQKWVIDMHHSLYDHIMINPDNHSNAKQSIVKKKLIKKK